MPESSSSRHPSAAGSAPARPARRNASNSEQHLRLLIESARDYAIFSANLDRKIDTWNSGAQQVFGYSEAEILGQSADIVFTPEDRARGAAEAEAEQALRTGRAEDERWHLRKNGERFFASGVMALLRDPGGAPIGFVKIARDLTERKLAADRLHAAREELEGCVRERTAELHGANESLRAEIAQRREAEHAREQLMRRIAGAQEEERLRLSRELHDEIGQHLAALALGLNSLERFLEPAGQLAALRQLQELADRIGHEIHAIAVQLRPAALDDLGVVRAIASYVEMWSERAGVPVDFHAGKIDEPRLPSAVELALYRIVQEALTNVLKHAAATRVSLILNRSGGDVVAVIEDNGRGFVPEAEAAGETIGLGLIGMRERVAPLHGRVTVESEPGRGTTVFVRVPLPAA